MATNYSLFSWNAQGLGLSGNSNATVNFYDTWDVLASRYMAHIWNANAAITGISSNGPFVLGGMAEAGDIPMGGGTIQNNPNKVQFAVNQTFSAEYVWCGWGNKSAISRCSLNTVEGIPNPIITSYPTQNGFIVDTGSSSRPALVSQLSKLPYFMLIMLHLDSGQKNSKRNYKALGAMIKYVETYNVPAIVMGDMNINILGLTDQQVMAPLNLTTSQQANWRLLRTNFPTQRKGGELDWGIAYKATASTSRLIGPLAGTTGSGRGLGWIAKGVSDHAILQFDLLI